MYIFSDNNKMKMKTLENMKTEQYQHENTLRNE